MAGHNSLELEIHNMHQGGATLDAICGEVLAKYEKNDEFFSVINYKILINHTK